MAGRQEGVRTVVEVIYRRQFEDKDQAREFVDTLARALGVGVHTFTVTETREPRETDCRTSARGAGLQPGDR